MDCPDCKISLVKAGRKNLTGNRYRQRWQCPKCGKYTGGEIVGKTTANTIR